MFVGLHFGARRFLPHGADAESNLLFFRIHFYDLEVELLTRFEMNGLAIGIYRFGIVAETLDPFGNFHECAKSGDPQYLALNNVSHMMLLKERFPNVGLKLLYAEREPPLVGFNGEHDGLHLVALLQYFRGMLHAFRPSHFANMNQPFDALFQLYKSAVIRDADHSPTNMSAHGITMRRIQPRIRRELFETQRNPLLLFVKFQHLDLDLVADVYQFARVCEPPP